MRNLILFLSLTVIDSVLCTAQAQHPDLRSGELDALRAVLEAEVDSSSFQRTEVGRYLEVRWDSRKQRQVALEGLSEAMAELTPEMVATFKSRNRRKFELWPAALKSLGERADSGVFLIAEPTGLHVQYARIGWDDNGERGLVYLELRPRESSQPMRAIFRVVGRSEDGWRVEPGRLAVDRGNYAREME